jgi:hypothetical protein
MYKLSIAHYAIAAKTTVLPAAVLPTPQVMIGASEVGSVMPLVKEGQNVKKVSTVATQSGRLMA